MSNFTFGTSTASTTFGANPATTTATAPTFASTPTLNFGATAASIAPTLGVTPTPIPTTTLPTLGTGNFNFGTPTTTPAPILSTTTAAPTFNFGNSTSVSATPATTLPVSNVPTLNFNTGLGGSATITPTTTVRPTLGGLGLGGNFSFGKTTPASTSTSGLNFCNTATQSTGFGGNKPLGLPAPSTTSTITTTPFIGLGGIDVSASQPKPGENKANNVKAKETLVPDEICKTVEALKTHIKTQKQLSSDIGRTSTSRLSNVSNEIGKMLWLLQEIANSVEINHNQIKLLRNETSKTVQSLEMAQRTQDTPAGLQYENQAPFQYFQELVAKYEQDLINIRQQITLTECHMQSITSPQTVTPVDLKRGLQQINESFISLAGRVHEVHQKVEAHKEEFLNLRKYRLRDSSNIFAQYEQPDTNTVQNMNIIGGPSPFPHHSAMDSFGRSFASKSAAAAAVNK